ncbi:MAG TPA: AMP-binding protein [Polyangiaceae bacterium]|nr:AMP-binding protein [Polyangiaceae bacterium]
MSAAARLAGDELSAQLSSLVLPNEDQQAELTWLEDSYADGPACATLWANLWRVAGSEDGRLRSRPGVSIELYVDAIARHAVSGGIAFTTLAASGELQHLSYAQLDAAATACAGTWSLAGVCAGQVVALALPMGLPWLIGFAAALRLGLTISCLSSFAETALACRLRALAPDRVVFDPTVDEPAEFAKLALPIVSRGFDHAPPAHGYAPEQPFGMLFSPLRSPLTKPTLLAAKVAFQWALRDAVFAYRLAPDSGLAMPGFPLEQYQPAVLLATLLSGARFIDLPMPLLQRNPAALLQPFITTLGVSCELRDLLREHPMAAKASFRDWWKSVDEPLDWLAWQDFTQKNGLRDLPVSNLLVDAASGGALLVSARRPGSIHALVLPSPGVPFVLSDVTSGAPALAACGVFQVGAKPDPQSPGWFLLVRRGSEYLYGSTLSPRRAGRVFAEQEVIDCVAGLPGVDGACIVPVATGEPGAVWAFVLVVFAGDREEHEFESLRRDLEAALRTLLGADFVPDHFHLARSFARHVDGKLDLDWCCREYSSGLMTRKSGSAAFQKLTALRAYLKGDSIGG